MELMNDATTLEQNMMANAARMKTPINGSLELLPLCNMNCDMCYVRLTPKELAKHGRIRSAEEWLKVGKEMQQAGVLFLLLTGGEPLLHPEFKEIYLGLKQMGFILTINTNGTLIDEEWAQFFGKNKPRRINVSVYGSDDRAYAELCHYPGGFERVINGIRMLKECGVDVKIAGSLTEKNRDDMIKLQEIGESLSAPVNIDSYMMTATRERDREFNQESRLSPEKAAETSIVLLQNRLGEEEFKNYVQYTLDQIDNGKETPEVGSRHMTCMAGSCSFTINWQGEVRPCVMLSEPSLSVFEHGFINCWNQIVEGCQNIYLSEKCASCSLRSICRICAAAALLETGKYDGTPEYLCRYYHRYEEILRIAKKSQSPS